MNYLVISPMHNSNYLVQVMNDNQYSALKKANVIDENASVYETDKSTPDLAQMGMIGMKSEAEIIQFIKDNNSEITHIEGPPFDDGSGDTD